MQLLGPIEIEIDPGRGVVPHGAAGPFDECGDSGAVDAVALSQLVDGGSGGIGGDQLTDGLCGEMTLASPGR